MKKLSALLLVVYLPGAFAQDASVYLDPATDEFVNVSDLEIIVEDQCQMNFKIEGRFQREVSFNQFTNGKSMVLTGVDNFAECSEKGDDFICEIFFVKNKKLAEKLGWDEKQIADFSLLNCQLLEATSTDNSPATGLQSPFAACDPDGVLLVPPKIESGVRMCLVGHSGVAN